MIDLKSRHLLIIISILCHTTLILLYRPFFVWHWDSELREHPLAVRAQTVCTQQTVGVNNLFRAYGQLFDFEYQSYLVSYCVYTAATIDVRLVRHGDESLAETAANRLAITLRMLETEVKQTPGIKRSIEIIRSQIDGPWRPKAQNVPESSSRAPHIREKPAGMPLDSITSVLPGIESPPSTISGTALYDSSAERISTEPLQVPPSQGLQITPEPNLAEWADWNLDDLGGGFVPDMAYWASLGHDF